MLSIFWVSMHEKRDVEYEPRRRKSSFKIAERVQAIGMTISRNCKDRPKELLACDPGCVLCSVYYKAVEVLSQQFLDVETSMTVFRNSVSFHQLKRTLRLGRFFYSNATTMMTHMFERSVEELPTI